MTTITKTFRDFFAENFKVEKRTNLFCEMAVPFHKETKPANFDKDDLEFLSQFPHNYWIKAKQARYQMLFDAVHKLHKDRHETHAQGELKNAILKAMATGVWDHLKGVVSDRNIAWLMRNVDKMNDREKEMDAEKLSHEHIRQSTPHIEEPDGEVAFSLSHPSDWNLPGGVKKPVTFMAKPFLNRLYHKLETTPGEAHHPESGLEGRGRYGYDMREPLPARTVQTTDEDGDEKEVSIPASTAGMKFPTQSQIRDRMIDFYNINMHRILGDLPEEANGQKVRWKQVKGFQDTWSAGYVRDQIQKRIEARLENDAAERGVKYERRSDLRKEAAELAKKQVIEMAKRGELKGPPIPGHPTHPDGYPIQVEGPEGKETLVNPPLYLPFVQKPIKRKDEETGAIKTSFEDVPVVNPSHFFRELGKAEEDYDTDEDGKRKYEMRNGVLQPVYKVPPEKLRGHEKQFVHVSDDEYRKGGDWGHKAAGAIDFNHGTEKELHMTKGNPDYEQRFQQIFGDQETTPEGFYKDIIQGIRDCFGDKCGGATAHELGILKKHIEDFHQIVVIKMLQRMGDDQLLTPQGRRTFTYSKVSSIMQKDQGKGGGTRRERALTQSARDVNFQSGGANKDISGELEAQVRGRARDTDDGSPGGGVTSMRASNKVGKGRRHRDTSGLSTPYNLGDMREALKQMDHDAREADATSGEAKKLSQRDTGNEIIKMLRDGINKQIDFKIFVTNTLTELYQQSMTPKEAKQAAEAYVRGWMEDGIKTAEAMLSAFKQHPLVVAAMQQAAVPADQAGQVQPGTKEAPPGSDEEEAMRFLQSAWERMKSIMSDDEIKDKLLPKAGQKHSAFVTELIAQQFGGSNNEKLMDRIQAEINRRLGVADKPQAAQAAKDVDLKDQRAKMRDILAKRKAGAGVVPPPTATPDAPKEVVAAPPKTVAAPTVPASTEDINAISARKDWVALAHHSEWLRHRYPEALEQKRKVLAWFHANRNSGKFQPHEYDSSVANLQKAIEGK